LINSGEESVHSRDASNVTALHWASINGHVEVVDYLLSLGAEVDAIGGELQSTPLLWAVRFQKDGNLGAMVSLVKAGANIYATDSQSYNALLLCAQLGHTMKVLYLLSLGLNVHLADKNGATALMWAVYKGVSEDV